MKHAPQQETPHYESSRLPYVCWYQNDFLGGVRGMRAHEIGIYTILLNEMYARGRPLELSIERLARLCGCDKRTFANVLEMLIEEGKILNLANGLWNKRCESVFQEREKLLEQKSFAGRCSAKKRKKINAEIEHLLKGCARDHEQNLEAQNREEKKTPSGVLEKNFFLLSPKEGGAEANLSLLGVSSEDSSPLKKQDTKKNFSSPSSEMESSLHTATSLDISTNPPTLPGDLLSRTTHAPNMQSQNLNTVADMQNSSPTNRNTATNMQEEHVSSSTPPMPSPTPHTSTTPSTNSSLTIKTANMPHQNLTAPADMQTCKRSTPPPLHPRCPLPHPRPPTCPTKTLPHRQTCKALHQQTATPLQTCKKSTPPPRPRCPLPHLMPLPPRARTLLSQPRPPTCRTKTLPHRQTCKTLHQQTATPLETCKRSTPPPLHPRCPLPHLMPLPPRIQPPLPPPRPPTCTAKPEVVQRFPKGNVFPKIGKQTLGQRF